MTNFITAGPAVLPITAGRAFLQKSTDSKILPVVQTDSTQVENDLPAVAAVAGPSQTDALPQLTFTS